VESGPVGIITGGLKGIGAATAVEFGRLGARVALMARSLNGSDELVERIRQAGGEAICVSGDAGTRTRTRPWSSACSNAGGGSASCWRTGGSGPEPYRNRRPRRWRR